MTKIADCKPSHFSWKEKTLNIRNAKEANTWESKHVWLIIRDLCLYFASFALFRTKKNPEPSLRPPSDTLSALHPNSITSSFWVWSFDSQRGKFSLTALSLWAFTCSKSTVETSKQGMNLFKINNKDTRTIS